MDLKEYKIVVDDKVYKPDVETLKDVIPTSPRKYREVHEEEKEEQEAAQGQGRRRGRLARQGRRLGCDGRSDLQHERSRRNRESVAELERDRRTQRRRATREIERRVCRRHGGGCKS